MSAVNRGPDSLAPGVVGHRYRKRPVEISAWQWWPHAPLRNLGDLAVAITRSERFQLREDGGLEIHTLEGVMTAQPGDWVIRGVQGEFYPCKPDIFAATYEAVRPAVGYLGQVMETREVTDRNGGELVIWVNERSPGTAMLRGGPRGGSRGGSVIIRTPHGPLVAVPGTRIVRCRDGAWDVT